jgi:hypothetical protein
MRQLGLMDGFANSDGQVEPANAVEGWVRPSKVDIFRGTTMAGSGLNFSYGESPQRLKAKSRMLTEFIDLAPEGDDRTIVAPAETNKSRSEIPYDEAIGRKIQAYAEKWGSLLGTRQDLGSSQPAGSRDLMSEPVYYAGTNIETFTSMLRTWSLSETIHSWRSYARTAKAMLLVASDLDNYPRIKGRQRHTMLRELNGWLINVGPHIHWQEGQYSIRLEAQNLLGALAVQLMTTIGRGKGIGLCGLCGGWFWVDGHRRKYCEGCGTVGSLREASNKLYLAKKRTRELFRKEWSAVQIADKLNRPVEQVSGWLEALKTKGSKADQRRAVEQSIVGKPQR